MEVFAVYDALETLLPVAALGVLIVSDSTYVVNCFRDRWWQGWEARGWKNSQKQPVANQDLWKPLIDLYKQHRSRIAFQWVKGHSGNPMNDLVDRLAVAAATSQRGRVLSWRDHPALLAQRADEPGASEPDPVQRASAPSASTGPAASIETPPADPPVPTALRLFD